MNYMMMIMKIKLIVKLIKRKNSKLIKQVKKLIYLEWKQVKYKKFITKKINLNRIKKN